MGCDISDRDDELLSPSPSVSVGGNSKRFKLSQKLGLFFEDCNGVGHALVPRKLRSAMKKRSGGSISPTLPDTKKLNRKIGGIESPKKDGVKKSKLNKQGDSDWSPSKAVSETITKDEEEVIETLHALAGMFTKDDETNRSKVDDEALETKPSTFLEASQRPMTAFEDSSVVKVDFDSICSSRTGEASNRLSNVERSTKGTVKVNSLNEPIVQVEQLELHNSKRFQMERDSSTSHVNMLGMPLFSKSEPADRKPVYNTVSVCVSSELSPSTGRLKLHKQQESSLTERRVLSLEQAAADGSQLDQHHSIQESKRNGPALWQGLSSTVSHGVGSHGPPLQSPAAKICASRRDSLENGFSTKKVPRVTADRIRRSRKRCAAHVSISHLIWDLQMPERKDMVPLQPDQLRSREGSNQGVRMVAHSFNGETNDLNGGISAVSIENSIATKNQNEARSSILEHTRQHQDQQQAALASGFCSSQKQSFNFLSLSAGAGCVEASSSTSRNVNVSETAQQFHIPYHHSFSQHQNFVPFSLRSTRHSSSALVDQISATQQVQQPQLPPYLGSPFGALTKQQLLMLQQQQQQQRLWAAQLAAQYRCVGTSTYIAPFPTLQNGIQDSSSLNPHAQTILPQSASCLEVLGSKYSPISPEQQQQQQQLIAIASPLPPSRLKRQDHHLTSVYEVPRGRSRAVQLLCKERL